MMMDQWGIFNWILQKEMSLSDLDLWDGLSLLTNLLKFTHQDIISVRKH